MANTIDSSLYLSNYQKNTAKTGNSNLGKDDFLKILITQLQHQDPANPMEDKDFIAQMATFSSLEQMTNMNTTMNNFINLQKQSNLISYSQFVGKEVNWHKAETDDSGNEVTTSGAGKVISVSYKDNTAEFTLEDGSKLSSENISSMNDNDNNLVEASQMIGKMVTYLDDNKNEQSNEVKSVSLKNGVIYFTLNDDTNSQITSNKMIKIE
ncbi:flagellar hook assembly protein FlgD [Niallia sp. 01092]|uniref:flagellar hook assembly protein FlgD n=1 Tax=unclassified Niallia TaxID=2837522 RepID=UPI003FD0F28D